MDDVLKEKIKSETAPIGWHELAPSFAHGRTLFVSKDLDIIDVAIQIAKDNKAVIEKWMSTKKIGKVTDQQARLWFENKSQVTATIISPWILVQDI